MSKIFHTEAGKGYPVILLHGFCESHQIWSTLQTDLSKQYKVIAIDLPGFGKSPLPPYDISLDTIANEVYEWLLEKNISECIMIGHSLGGYITLEIAKKFPNIFKAFGLFQSTAYADTKEKKENRNKSIDFLEKHGIEKFIDSFVPMLFTEARRGELAEAIAELKKTGEATAVETAIKYTAAMRDRDDSIWLLQEYEKPILWVAGEEDAMIPINKAKEQIKLIKHPYVKLMPSTGHVAMIERPNESALAIRRFLQVVI